MDCGCVCIADNFVVHDLWIILLWMICVDLGGIIYTSSKKKKKKPTGMWPLSIHYKNLVDL